MTRLTPDRLRKLRHPGAWRNLALDAAWRLAPRSPDPVPLSWPISDDVKRNLRVRWPARFGWANAEGLVGPLRDALQQLVYVDFVDDVPQPLGNIVVFECTLDGASTRVGLDYEDRVGLHETADEFPLFFKMQYQRGGYGRAEVVPGGYVTPTHGLYKVYPRFREYRARQVPQFELYGRFSLNFAPELRRRAVELLNDQNRFQFEGGVKPVIWSEYVREACRAKLCLDLPGRGPFCARFVEYLALGCPVLAPLQEAVLPVPVEDGEHVAYARADLTDLVDVAERYLNDDEARKRLSRNARDYFDRYLRPEQLASYYVDRCVAALN